MLTSLCIHTYVQNGGARNYRAYSSSNVNRGSQHLLQDSLIAVGLDIEQPLLNQTPFGRLDETHSRRSQLPLQDRANGIWFFVNQGGVVSRESPIFAHIQEQEANQYVEQHPGLQKAFAEHQFVEPV